MLKKYGVCYEIIRDGIVKGYLFGSFHMFYKNKNFKDSIMDSFRKSDCLILEANLDKNDLDKELNPESIEENLYYKDGDNVFNYLKTQNDKYNYKKLLKPFGLKKYLMMTQLKKIKIEMLKNSYTVLALQNKGISLHYGIDKYFFDLAKSLNKETLFLEEIKFQLDLIRSLNLNSELAIEQDTFEEPIKEEVDIFKDFDEYISLCNKQVKDMFNIVSNYRKNNIKTLRESINNEFEDMPIESRNAILLNRNVSMAEKIDMVMLEGKKPFICVGLAHLIAENNIASMLRNKGYYLNLM